MSDQQNDESQVSQETPNETSNLQTPQADQPFPTEDQRDGEPQVTQAPDPEQSAQPVEDQSAAQPKYPTSQEMQAQEDARLIEKEAAQREHAQRTGGGEVREGELQAQRDEHNARVGGGA